jgi:preprotein translocase subunit SecG
MDIIYNILILTIIFFILGIIFHIIRIKKKQKSSLISIIGLKQMIKKKKV